MDEEYSLSLDTYSKEIEYKIDGIISLRNVINSITSYDHLLRQKTKIIQTLFETEDLLRNSCMFIRKTYIKLKHTLQINTIPKENNKPYVNSLQLCNITTHIDNQQAKNDENKNDNDSQQPITFKGKDEFNLNEDVVPKNDSFAKRCQQTTSSYHFTTEKDNGKNNNMILDNYVDSIDHSQILVNQKNLLHAKLPDLKKSNRKNNQSNSTCKKENANIKRHYIDIDSYQNAKDYLYKKKAINKSMDCSNKNYDENSLGKDIKQKDNQTSNSMYFDNKRGTQKEPNSDLANRRKLKLKENNLKKAMINKYQHPPIKNDVMSIKLDPIDYDSIIKNQDSYLLPNTTTNKLNASKVADIIMKLNMNQTVYQIIKQLFDESILDKLMEVPPNQELIEAVEESIFELERLEEKDKQKNIELIKFQKDKTHLNALNIDYIAFENNKSTYGIYNQKIRKNNHRSCSFGNSKSESIQGLNLSLINALNKKTTFADDLLAYTGLMSTKNSKIITHHNNLNFNHSMLNSPNNLNSSPPNEKCSLPLSKKNSLNKKKNNTVKPKTCIMKVKQFIHPSLKKLTPSSKYLNISKG